MLEEENQALLSDKAGETEYLHSLQQQIEKLKVVLFYLLNHLFGSKIEHHRYYSGKMSGFEFEIALNLSVVSQFKLCQLLFHGIVLLNPVHFAYIYVFLLKIC